MGSWRQAALAVVVGLTLYSVGAFDCNQHNGPELKGSHLPCEKKGRYASSSDSARGMEATIAGQATMAKNAIATRTSCMIFCSLDLSEVSQSDERTLPNVCLNSRCNDREDERVQFPFWYYYSTSRVL